MASKIKRVLSFDVGIINLAYCLMDIDIEAQRFTIIDWNIIDTADERHLCPFIMRGGKVCNKVAQKVTKVGSRNMYYACNAHWNKSTHMIKPVDVEWVAVDSGSSSSCTTCSSKNAKTVKPGIFVSDLFDGAYCDAHYKTLTKQNNYVCCSKGCDSFITFGLFLHTDTKTDTERTDTPCVDTLCVDTLSTGWCDEHYTTGYADLIKAKTRKISQNANKTPLVSIGTSMYTSLDSKPEFLKVDEILVENQPSLINPTMKSVAMILYSYFLMRCFHQKLSPALTLSYCSASNKLKIGGQKVAAKLEDAKSTLDMQKSSNKKKVYNITKKTAKKIAAALISDNADYQTIFNSHKKQDDLADSMLQAFVMNFKEVPDYYAQLLEKADITDEDKDVDDKTKTTKPVKPTRGRGRFSKAKTVKTVEADPVQPVVAQPDAVKPEEKPDANPKPKRIRAVKTVKVEEKPDANPKPKRIRAVKTVKAEEKPDANPKPKRIRAVKPVKAVQTEQLDIKFGPN